MKQKVVTYSNYTGNIESDTETLNQIINQKSSQKLSNIQVMVLPETIILINKDKKIAAMAELNFEMASPIDLERVAKYWEGAFSNLGYQFGQLEPEDMTNTVNETSKRKFKIGYTKHKIKQHRKMPFDWWLDQFEQVLSPMSKDEQKELLEILQMPDSVSDEEKKDLLLKSPRSAEQMAQIDPERFTSIILEKYLSLAGGKVKVETKFVDPDDHDKGFMTHIKKENN